MSCGVSMGLVVRKIGNLDSYVDRRQYQDSYRIRVMDKLQSYQRNQGPPPSGSDDTGR